jgi:hypothetical protein
LGDTITDIVEGMLNKRVKFQGATFCCLQDWFQWLPKFINQNAERLASISVHAYALSVCGGVNVTVEELVTYKLTPGGYLLDGQAAATANGVEYWLAETNSVSCSGAPGVSDSFGAGLWAIDWMFNGAALGYRGMNFHGAGGNLSYAAWGYDAENVLKVNPLYYAMLAFARTIGVGQSAYILPAGSPLLSVNSSQPQVSVWSVGNKETNVRKVIINNRNITGTGAMYTTVTVKLTHGEWNAEAGLTFFQAPSAYVTEGVSLSGQTFDGSTDGRIRGERQVIRVVAKAKNEWRFEMKPGSTAFLSICPAGQSSAVCYL